MLGLRNLGFGPLQLLAQGAETFAPAASRAPENSSGLSAYSASAIWSSSEATGIIFPRAGFKGDLSSLQWLVSVSRLREREGRLASEMAANRQEPPRS